MITQHSTNTNKQAKNAQDEHPLGTIAIVSSAYRENAKSTQRIKRYRLLAEAQKILTKHNVCNPRNGNPHRTRFCHARRNYMADNISIKLNSNDLSSEASIGNVQTCGSVWSCAICASRIAVEKGTLVKKALLFAEQNNLIPIMVTLTAKHHIHTPLVDFKGKFKSAWKMFSSHRQWRKFKRKYGIKHWIANREVTYGKSGWHYHMHLLLFLDAIELKYADEKISIEKTLRKLWLDCLDHKGLSGVGKYAINVSANENVGAEYLTKIGLTEDAKTGDLQYELTASGSKTSGYKIWDILRHASYGDELSEKLYIEFVGAMFGDSFLSFSKGLLPLIEQVTLSEGEENLQTMTDWIYIAPYWWRIVVRTRSYGNLLECAGRTRNIQSVEKLLFDLQDELIEQNKLPEYHRVFRRMAASSEDNIICIREVV